MPIGARVLVPVVILGACAPVNLGDGRAEERAAGAANEEACEADDARAVEVTVEAQPDAGTDHVAALIRGAVQSIDLAIYLIGDDNDAVAALLERSAEIPVRVLVDGRATSPATRDVLAAAGAEVRTQPDAFEYVRYGPYYHPKFAVIDGSRAWVSTGNLREPYMSTERNYDVRDDDPQDVADLAELFAADWDRRAPEVDCTRLVIAPLNARDRLLAFIDGAADTLEVESMQLADRQVRAHLAARSAAGVEVRVVLADACWIEANRGAADFLASAGIEARWMSEYSAHVKMMVADGERAYLGSVNLSRTSIDRNREVGLVVSDAAALAVLAETFDHDWSTAGTDWGAFPGVCR